MSIVSAYPAHRGSSLCYLAACLIVGMASALVIRPASAQSEEIPQVTPKRIVADYTSDSKYLNPPYSAKQIPYDKLTHIIHAGVPFDSNGELSVPDGFIEPELNRRAHRAGVKVLLLIGGDVTGLEGNPSALPELTENLRTLVKTNGYDGVDLDWEYPSSAEDTSFLLKLMSAIRKVLPSPQYVLSIDVAPWGADAYDPRHLKKVIDWFNIMSYDCAGPWTAHAQLNAPIFWDGSNPAPEECEPGGSDQQAIDIFLKEVPASQLNLGTPFYGYEYLDVNKLFGLCPASATTSDGNCDDNDVPTLNYGPDIKKLIDHQGWKTYYDVNSLVPYMLRRDGSPGFITYDDPLSTFMRVWYADWDRNLGGTFVWSLDADYDGHSQDLLEAMYLASHRSIPADWKQKTIAVE